MNFIYALCIVAHNVNAVVNEYLTFLTVLIFLICWSDQF